MSKVSPTSWAWRLKRLNVRMAKFCYDNEIAINTYQAIRSGSIQFPEVAQRIEIAIRKLEQLETTHDITLSDLFEVRSLLHNRILHQNIVGDATLLNLVNTTIQHNLSKKE